MYSKCNVFDQFRQDDKICEFLLFIYQERTLSSANDAFQTKIGYVICSQERFESRLLTSIGTLSQNVNEDSMFIWFRIQCFVHPFAITIKMLIGALCATLREMNSHFSINKRLDEGELTLRKRVLVEFLGKNMCFSQNRPMFAHNPIIKCSASLKDRLPRAIEVTWRVMLLQKNPDGSPKYSSSSQLLSENFR